MKNEIFFDIQVDIDSLSSFIESSKRVMSNQVTDNAYYKKIQVNLTEASKLLFEIEKKENSYVLTDQFCLSDSGTVFGKRFSELSNELKTALIGKCSKVQIKESNFACLASIAKTYNPTLNIDALLDFIKHKSHTCETIALEIKSKKYIIEKVFSLIDLTNSVSDITTELQRILGDSFDQLLGNYQFECILTDIMKVKVTILQETDSTVDDQLKWVHEAYESMILDKLVQLIPEQYEPIVTDRDCVYVRYSIPSDILVDIKYQIRELFPLIDFVKTHVIPIHLSDFKSKAEIEHESDLQLHRSRIIEDTELAKHYQSHFCTVNNDSIGEKVNPMNQNQIVEQNYLAFLHEVYGET